MEYLQLRESRDVDDALRMVRNGQTVEAECGDERGIDGSPEPMVELLQELLDQAIFENGFDVIEGQRIPHPTLGRKYLRNCVILPGSDLGNESGVREPRRPRPSNPTRTVALPLY